MLFLSIPSRPAGSSCCLSTLYSKVLNSPLALPREPVNGIQGPGWQSRLSSEHSIFFSLASRKQTNKPKIKEHHSKPKFKRLLRSNNVLQEHISHLLWPFYSNTGMVLLAPSQKQTKSRACKQHKPTGTMRDNHWPLVTFSNHPQSDPLIYARSVPLYQLPVF